MNFSGSLRSRTPSAVLFAVAVLSAVILAAAHAAIPFDSATVTRVENKVSYGQVKGGHSQTRPAAAQDTVKADNFVLSETASRAELQYPDGSIVRVGQNTVFSFDADTRTLILKKGRFIGYIPPGGSCTVKTPSFTAAITGGRFQTTETVFSLQEGFAQIDGGPPVGEGQFYNATTGTVGTGYFSGGTVNGAPLSGASPGAAPFNENFHFQGAYPDQDTPGQTGPGSPQNSASQVSAANPVIVQETKVKVKGPFANDAPPPTFTPVQPTSSGGP